ncbi:MAG TPA: RNA polymerase sigma factor [Firmicutes bacterium]|nr:RNA polymerase sigma factor [Bacillota bacterium]
MRKHLNILYHFIRLRVSVPEDVQDIVQDVMLSVWQSLASFQENARFKTWVLGIANHKIQDYFRKKYRRKEENMEDPAAFQNAGEGEESVERAIIRTDMRQAVAALKQADQELVFLIFHAELNYAEISQLTGMPTGTIKSRMAGIKAKLRQSLGEKYHG